MLTLEIYYNFAGVQYHVNAGYDSIDATAGTVHGTIKDFSPSVLVCTLNPKFINATTDVLAFGDGWFPADFDDCIDGYSAAFNYLATLSGGVGAIVGDGKVTYMTPSGPHGLQIAQGTIMKYDSYNVKHVQTGMKWVADQWDC